MNRLSKETSPYLLQHANNPVDWFAWKPEAFEIAKREDKPVLVSIGYSTCHWCHVMEHESFEDEEVAAFMNDHFVNIKVDREERPDLDQIYMEACQIISGSGGWPLNCFLTPEGKPFYAATYFPPEPRYNRPSWLQVLNNLSNAFRHKRETVEDQANRLMSIIQNSDNKMLDIEIKGLVEESETFNPSFVEAIFKKIKESFDVKEGGFGGAPKFPGSMALNFLLQYHYHTKNEDALDHVNFSLEKMIHGGIYDQLGGGFARYAVDRAWLVPHFEKMLYDNALLIELLSDAYKLTSKELYAETIRETLEYVAREMTSPEGAFYSAQDADSEGEEGKFYVWSRAEVADILGNSADLFCDFYDITKSGNWEGKNILRRLKSFEEFAEKHQLDLATLKDQLKQDRAKLFSIRDKRIYPGLDDKILLDWNALMCSAYANAYKALGDDTYKTAALKNLDFIFDKMQQQEGPAMYHTYKDGKVQYDAFLNDYAFLIKAVLDVYEVSFDFDLLKKAEHLTEFVLEHFLDEDKSLFYFTRAEQEDVITRKKEIYDSAMPSGNSIMLSNLKRLALVLNRPDLHDLTSQMLLKMKGAVHTYPRSFGQWAIGVLETTFPGPEVAILGSEAYNLANEINKGYLPGAIMMASRESREDFDLLQNRYQPDKSLIYLCRNYSCQRPVNSTKEFWQLL